MTESSAPNTDEVFASIVEGLKHPDAITDKEMNTYRLLDDIMGGFAASAGVRPAVLRATLDGTQPVALVVAIQMHPDGATETAPLAILVTNESGLFERLTPPVEPSQTLAPGEAYVPTTSADQKNGEES
jgi:hypothetical protein